MKSEHIDLTVTVPDSMDRPAVLAAVARTLVRKASELMHESTHALGSWDHSGTCEEWIKRAEASWKP